MLQEKYVTNWKVFKCPFDKRADATTDSAPVSYGINANVLTQVTKPGWDGNFSRLVSPSQLILMAPEVTDDAGSVPTFDAANVATKAVSLKSRSGESKKLGTHSGRAQINALFADSHVASLRYLPHTDAEAFTCDVKETSTALQGMVVKWDPIKPAK